MPDPRRVQVGVIGAPRGVRGEVRLRAFTTDPMALARYPLTSEDGARRFELIGAKPLKDDLITARLAGVASREAAAALTNTPLYVAREHLPPPEEEEYYHADLVGLRAEDAAGAPLGTVAALLNHGAGDLLEIARPGMPSLLVPFTRLAVPVVDVAGGRVVVDLPAEVEGEPPDGDGSGEDADEGAAP